MKKLFFYSLIMLSFLAPAALQANSFSKRVLWDEQNKTWASFMANDKGIVYISSPDKNVARGAQFSNDNLKVSAPAAKQDTPVRTDTVKWD